MVSRRDHLSAACPGLPRQRRGRHRRLRRADREARLPEGSGRDRALAAAVLSQSAPGRRLRHRRLQRRQSVLRHAPGLQGVSARGPQARPQGHHRAGDQPHLRPAPVVPARAPGPAGLAGPRFLRLEPHRRPLHRCAHHLQGLRALQLDLGRRGGRLLLASLLFAPARSQLRQSHGPEGDLRRARFLAQDGRGRAAARRGAVSLRAGGHQLREPAGDPRLPEGAAPPARRQVPQPDAARRGEPVARGRGRVLRRTATSATWRSTSR